MNTSGGFAQYIRVPSAWVVPMPSGLTPREAMIFGTAGFTAALSVHRIIEREGIVPDRGEVLVTGASGGVGCLAVAMLGKLGYNVVAGTGKLDQADWLKQVGATSVISREELDDKSGRPLMKPRWAAVVDTVGGNILASAIKTTQMNGCVTACGLVQSSELHGTVFPFILRGVNLCGIDSGETKMPLRAQMWGRLAGEWKPSPQTLDAITTECALDDINTHIDTILRGGVRGRVVVRVD
jgi:putative YhdH/YhfP family quinone oxidoreductase